MKTLSLHESVYVLMHGYIYVGTDVGFLLGR